MLRQSILPYIVCLMSGTLLAAAIGTSSAAEAAIQDEAEVKAKSEETKADEAKPKKQAKGKGAQNRKQKKQNEEGTDTGKRLDAIEKSLQELAQAVQSLATVKPQPAEAEASSPAQPSQEAQPERERGREQEDQSAIPAAVKLDAAWLDDVSWRSIGPANMAGRVTDVAVHEQDPSLWWIATASGGLLKTTNRGVTVEHQFDREKVVSIGAIATDPKNKDVLWVGTGEINPRNSVSYGNGIYKSVDGGESFLHKGLDRSFQIAKILVHPENTDTVYVGAAGRLYGTNSERGVYKTTNGGDSWEQVLYVDDQTGVIDMIMNPEDPDTIIVAMWDRMRDGFDSWPGNDPKPDGVDGYDPIRKYGPGGGLYKTTDGGREWKKLTEGLPTGMTGRIGLDWQSKSPYSIYAIIDCEDIGRGPKPFPAFLGIVGTDIDNDPTVTQLFPDSPAAKAGVLTGDVLKRVGDQEISKFDQLLDVLREKKIGDKLTLTLERGSEELSFETQLTGRPGTSPQRPPTIWIGAFGEDQEGGIVLGRISEGGPAASAGLKEGDVITKVDGRDVAGFRQLMTDLQEKSEGDKVSVQAKRGEETLDVTLTLAARAPGGQQQQTPAQSNVYMGIQGENADGGGARMTTISEGGPAEKAGLRQGDIVRRIDGRDITDYEAMVSEIRRRQPDDKMKVSVKRGDSEMELEVTLADRLGGGSAARPYTYSYFGQTPNIQDQQGAEGYKYGGIYRSTDGGETWERINSLNTRPMYFSIIRVDPSDNQRLYVLGVSQFQSNDGGITFTGDLGRRVHADGHDLWIDPNDGRQMLIGSDGGFYVTHDRGESWDHINTAAIGQFYHVSIGPKSPYWVAGGLQDNGSWAGPAISRNGGTLNEDWINVGGGDGFVCRIDPDDPDLVYSESQNGAISRRHLLTGERASIRPPRVEGVTYRFNWNTPFLLSGHNSKIFYSAGNFVFRSLDRGNDLRAISPEITLTTRGSATALAESPRNPDVLYVGTDDGALWVTQNGGHEWTNITANLGIPEPRWVATIEPSRYADGRVYICLDAHRSDDDQPYVFVSEDFGQTFRPLHEELPWGSTRCLREDIRNQNLLYLGTEFGFRVSMDRGQHWTQFNQSLPTVAIHEVAQHPVNGEIVVATHGRSLWACDVTGLRQISADHLQDQIALHDPVDVIRWRREPSRGGTNRRFVSSDPEPGARIWYSLPAKAERVSVRIEDIEGQVVSELNGDSEAGLHLATWNLTQSQQRGQRPGGGGAGQSPGRRPESGSAGRGSSGRSGRGEAEPGTARAETPAAAEDAATAEARGQESPRPAGSRGRGGFSGRPGGFGGGGRPRPSPDETRSGRPAQEAGEQSESESGAPQEESSAAESESEENPSESRPAAPATASPQAPGGRPPQGFSGFRGSRPVPNGTYRVTLIVDGKEIGSTTIDVERDPALPADAIADEQYELQLLLDAQAAEDKHSAKSAGRGVWADD